MEEVSKLKSKSSLDMRAASAASLHALTKAFPPTLATLAHFRIAVKRAGIMAGMKPLYLLSAWVTTAQQQNRTAQQHSTATEHINRAQHSTAQHSTAQHSTAQHAEDRASSVAGGEAHKIHAHSTHRLPRTAGGAKRTARQLTECRSS